MINWKQARLATTVLVGGCLLLTMADTTQDNEIPFGPNGHPDYSHLLEGKWPQGGLDCYYGFRKFDPLLQKKTYYVGVHAPSGLDVAWREFNLTFEEYLDRSVGDRFIPPIRFKMKPTQDPLRDWVDKEEEIDFMYSDTGLYSCIGVEIGGQPLGTTISHLTARGRSFNLDIYGGSIVTRADNADVKTIHDLKDKIIGAQSVSDFSGAQVQFYEMFRNNLDYIMDPKQVIFTENQEDIVKGVLDGRWDVGFVRTGQIERTKDDDGEVIDSSKFKIIEPKTYIMDTGELFPFLHSTPVFPEWPLFAKPDVDRIVSEEVQIALINFEYHKIVGDAMHTCQDEICDPDGYGMPTNCSKEEWEICETAPPVYFDPAARCDTTREMAELAYQAGIAGRHNGFRPARSHFSLRTMQQTAGFLTQNERGNWQCTRAETLYDGIICPQGHYKVKRADFEEQCNRIGLPCPDGYKCYCKPCVKAFEVDVMQLNEEEGFGQDKDLQVSGCDKMDLCGSVPQKEVARFRLYDNRERENAAVSALMHVRQESVVLPVHKTDNASFVYEVDFSDNELGVSILEVFFDGVQIPESPFRVEVTPRNCELEFPGEGKEPTKNGECECGEGKIEMGSKCMDTAIFAAIVVSIFAFLVLVATYFYLQHRRAKADEAWQVKVEELHFGQHAQVIGQGSFGIVLLAEYRGTKVAIKRVLPLKQSGSQSGSRTGSRSGSKGSKGSADKSFDPNGSIDVEAQDPGVNVAGSYDPYSSGRYSGKGDSWSDDALDFLGHLSFGRERTGLQKMLPFLFRGHESYNASILGTASGGNTGSTRSVFACVCPWLDANNRRKQEFMAEMRLLSKLRHPCITTVMGATMARGQEPMMVMEYMENGSLYDLLRNETMYTGGEIILQIIRDVAQGLRFLHSSKPPILHGDLKAKNILVDSRFRAKVADFGLSRKKGRISGTPFWMAPEYLRGRTEYNSQCDIYAFGIILFEIYARALPYEGENFRRVLRSVCDPRVNKRPPVPVTCPPRMAEIMTKCWSQDPFFRPQAKELDVLFMDLSSSDTEPLLDESKKGMRTEKPTGDMLYQLFPRKVADKLKAGQSVDPETHENVTVFFSDIVDFTEISRKLTAQKVCDMLDRLYVSFDELARKHKVFKVETIGDAWMGVTNLENDQSDTHVKRIAEFSIDAIHAAGQIMLDEDNPSMGYISIRAGFHSGSVVSNVIGSLNPRYGLFGDTVNTASRMESNSMSRKIQCSDAAANLLREQAPQMPIKKRGKVAIKGKGEMVTYWVGLGLLKDEHDGSCSKTLDDNVAQALHHRGEGGKHVGFADDDDDDTDVSSSGEVGHPQSKQASVVSMDASIPNVAGGGGARKMRETLGNSA